jgi:hypothetical protein
MGGVPAPAGSTPVLGTTLSFIDVFTSIAPLRTDVRRQFLGQHGSLIAIVIHWYFSVI